MNDNRPGLRDTLEYHPETDTHRVTYSSGTDSPSMVVVEAVAAIADKDVDELDPLYEVLDPMALDALFRPALTGDHRGDCEVSFTYHGYEVAVRSYGVIEIQAPEDGEEPRPEDGEESSNPTN